MTDRIPIRTVLACHSEPENIQPVFESRASNIDVHYLSSMNYLLPTLEKIQPDAIFSLSHSNFPRSKSHMRLAIDYPSIRWFHVGGSGYEHIIPWDHKRVVVTNSTGILAPFLVETVLGAMLILNGNFIKYAEQQKNHVWLPHHFTPLCEKVLLVIGLGTIGSLIAQKAQSLGMRVIGIRRHPAPNPFVDEVYADNELPKLIGQADFVSLHVRMSEKNMNLINKNILSAMKIGSFLINTARGSVVDENALLDSLNNGPLAGAYLDVFENEPLPKDNDLWNHPNVIITPHAADNIKDWPVRFADFFMDNLLRWNNNDNLLNEITP